MNAPEETPQVAPVLSKDDCEHVIHEWPVTGPWVDYTCANCGQNWRLFWRDSLPAGPSAPPQH